MFVAQLPDALGRSFRGNKPARFGLLLFVLPVIGSRLNAAPLKGAPPPRPVVLLVPDMPPVLDLPTRVWGAPLSPQEEQRRKAEQPQARWSGLSDWLEAAGQAFGERSRRAGQASTCSQHSMPATRRPSLHRPVCLHAAERRAHVALT